MTLPFGGWRAAPCQLLTDREIIVAGYRNETTGWKSLLTLRQLYQPIKPRRQIGLRIGKALISGGGNIRFEVHPATWQQIRAGLNQIGFARDDVRDGERNAVGEARRSYTQRLEQIAQAVGIVRITQIGTEAENVLESAHSGAVSIMNTVAVAAALGPRRQGNQPDRTVAVAATFIPGNDQEAATGVSG